MTMLRAIGLDVGFGTRVLLRDVHLELATGGMVALIGRNGAGKTTLLNTLSGAHRPLRGRVLVDGHNVHAMPARERAQLLAVVLSHAPRVGALDVRTLVSFGRIPWTGPFGRMGNRDRDVVERSLEDSGVYHLAERPVDELSDGERQRVMVARALAQEAPVLLLDEPLAHLDLVNRAHLMQLLRRIVDTQGRAVLFSTHDLSLALDISDRIALVGKEERSWIGTPAEALDTDRVADEFNDDSLYFDRASRSIKPR